MPARYWFMILLTVVGFAAFIVPGIIMYIMVIRKVYRFHNLVVTANPMSGGSDVVLQYPPAAGKLAARFLEALPPLAANSPAASQNFSEAPISRFCTQCGNQLKAGRRFCPSCGSAAEQ